MTRTTTVCALVAALSLSGCFASDESAPECDVSTPCPMNFICQGGECTLACPPRTRDVDGVCEDIPLECTTGSVDGVCVDRPPECTTGAECPGNICDEGQCRFCREDSECDGEVCLAGGCEAPCTDTAECEAGEVCHRGTCGVTCADDSSVCSAFVLAQLVRGSEGERDFPRLARLGCRISFEALVDGVCDGTLPHRGEIDTCDSCLASLGGCGMGQTCENGDCTCAANEDCPGSLACLDGYCAPCSTDAECGCGMYCSTGTCHERCETDDECPDNFVCAGGRCAGCQSDANCEPGERCYEDGCVDPCDSSGESCSSTGRRSVCEVYEPIGELTVSACM